MPRGYRGTVVGRLGGLGGQAFENSRDRFLLGLPVEEDHLDVAGCPRGAEGDEQGSQDLHAGDCDGCT